MKAFQIKRQAITAIIEGLILDFSRTLVARKRASLGNIVWDNDLVLSEESLSVDTEQLIIYQNLVAEFFNVPSSTFVRDRNTLGQWADLLLEAIDRKMEVLNFRPAGSTIGFDGEKIVEETLDYSSPETYNAHSLCGHRADRLFQEAAAAASLLQGRRRLVTLISPHSVLGFIVTVLMPALQKIEVLDARHMLLEEVSSQLTFGDVMIATPSLWAYLMREDIKAPDNIMAVSFGEMMTMDLATKLRRNGFGVLRELYGSTQTGLVAWRDTPNDDFVLFDHWTRSGDNLIRHYPDGKKDSIIPMDFFAWKNSRNFQLSGRRDGAVQIGAVNVFPEKIATIITEYPNVEKCSVRMINTGFGTNRLIADIYLKGKHKPDRRLAQNLDQWCRNKLAINERPHILNFYQA